MKKDVIKCDRYKVTFKKLGDVKIRKTILRCEKCANEFDSEDLHNTQDKDTCILCNSCKVKLLTGMRHNLRLSLC